MSQTNEELTKNIVSVIDETIQEIEELRKSKFDAQEVKMHGEDGKMKEGYDANGSMGKEEDKKKDDDEEKDKEGKDEAEKAEGKGVNTEADPDKGPYKEASTVSKEEHGVDKAEGKGVNTEADPDKGPYKEASTVSKEEGDMDKKEDDKEDDDKDKKDDKDMDKMDMGYDLKRSIEEQESLMKSYVDEKIGGLENKIASVLDAVKTLSEQPVARKGVSAEAFRPLEKGAGESDVEPLNKSYVSDTLLKLKKSGTQVDSADIVRVETGSQEDVQSVAKKYELVK